MNRIREGVRHFREHVFPQQRRLFADLADGQSPNVMFIACADARVDPSLITTSPPGTLFVLRNAGNLIPPHGAAPGGEAATLHYAIETLGVHHIVVCGHSGCGAMTQLMTGADTGSPVDLWLRYAASVRDDVAAHHPRATPRDQIEAAVYFNAMAGMDNLRSHPVVREAEAAGKLALHAWKYHIETGAITAYDKQHGAFVPLEEAHTEQPVLDDLATWSATLSSVGADPAAVTEAIVKITSWPRLTVVSLFDRLPLELLTGLSHVEAEVVETWLCEAGATMSLHLEHT